MGNKDIRFSKQAATLEHRSARGNVIRNSGDFTRGSQLFTHHLRMWWAGVQLPLIMWVATTAVMIIILGFATLLPHEVQLVGMKLLAEFWNLVEFDPSKAVNLTLPNGSVVRGEMGWVPDHPAVEAAWKRMVGIFIGGALAGAFFCVPLTIWFVDFSNRKGGDILKERHERGSILVEQSELADAVRASNALKHAQECEKKGLDKEAIQRLAKMSVLEKARHGFHVPYVLAGAQFPWRSEQQHTMFLGTTGTGKTTELKRLVLQARARGHRCVIFDLTGSFVESFYNPETDHIMNPRDARCRAWTIFNDARDYVDLMNAAQALIPDPHGRGGDDFWQKAARMLFVEMCVKLKEEGHCSNGALAHHLMEIELSEINEKLAETIAAPLVSEKAAKMAESVRATFNTHANAIRFLPDPTRARPPFSLRDWITREDDEGSILFLTSSYSDMILNKPLLTMWLNIVMQGLFTMGRTRDLRTWFLIDEIHALHRVPAIEQGLQTARQVGGAIVLGMHSFEKLKETYGDEGAKFIDGLAGTKLLLRAADGASAKHASEAIGEREIRQMDEAYSYGANTIRDGTTITPTKKVEPLVLPTDIRDLPDLHGFLKFGQGFPAARVEIKWRDYKKQAEPFEQLAEMRAAAWPPVVEDVEEGGEDGASGADLLELLDPRTGEVVRVDRSALRAALGGDANGDGGNVEGEEGEADGGMGDTERPEGAGAASTGAGKGAIGSAAEVSAEAGRQGLNKDSDLTPRQREVIAAQLREMAERGLAAERGAEAREENTSAQRTANDANEQRGMGKTDDLARSADEQARQLKLAFSRQHSEPLHGGEERLDTQQTERTESLAEREERMGLALAAQEHKQPEADNEMEIE